MTHRGALSKPQSDGIDIPTDAEAGLAASRFAMLSDPTRLKILWLISRQEQDVTTIAGLIAITPTVASQHLAKLRLAGLVNVRADGKRRLYAVHGSHMRTLIEEALGEAEHHLSGIAD